MSGGMKGLALGMVIGLLWAAYRWSGNVVEAILGVVGLAAAGFLGGFVAQRRTPPSD